MRFDLNIFCKQQSECNVAYIAHQRSQSVTHLKPPKPLIYYCIEKNNTTNQNEDSLPSSTSKSDTIQSSAVAGRWVSTDNVPFSESFKNNLVPLAASLFHTCVIDISLGAFTNKNNNDNDDGDDDDDDNDGDDYDNDDGEGTVIAIMMMMTMMTLTTAMMTTMMTTMMMTMMTTMTIMMMRMISFIHRYNYHKYARYKEDDCEIELCNVLCKENEYYTYMFGSIHNSTIFLAEHKILLTSLNFFISPKDQEQ